MNINKIPMYNNLPNLDPERDTTLDVRADRQALATLDGILSSPAEGQFDTEGERKVIPTGAPRRRARYLVGTAAGIAALAIGITTFGPSTPSAFASWTPTPQNVAPDNLSDIATGCDGVALTLTGKSNDGSPHSSMSDDESQTPRVLENTITEQRGDFTSAVMVDKTPGDEYLAFCIRPKGSSGKNATSAMRVLTDDEVEDPAEAIRRVLEPDEFVLASNESIAVIFGSDSQEETARAEAGVDDPRQKNGPSLSWRKRWQQPTLVALGSDVKAISFNLTDGTEVQANINNDWWTAWWPTSLGDVKEVTVTTSTGTQVVDL